jgi:prepilin-type N-terminal cleavage/methylation domain-containing protein
VLPGRTRSRHASRITRYRAYASLSSDLCPPTFQKHGFTLLELLVVVAIIVLLMVLVAPAFTTQKSANDFTAAAYTITGVLEQARTLAISKNTYVWVGFYEEDAAASTPTTSSAPYTGKGRLVLATVYSTDGTEVFSPTLSGSHPLPTVSPATPNSSPQAWVKQYGRIVKIDNIHMTDIGSPTPGPSPSPDSLNARSDMPYTSPAPATSSTNRLSSDSSDATRFQFTVQNYTFLKTVRFSPRGEARLNTSYDYRRAAEIGLIPTHGNITPTAIPANAIAIQFNAFGGQFKIYRQ